MNKLYKYLQTTAAAAAITAAMAVTGAASAGTPGNSVKLLTANFDARQVVQVEVGDFHFKPGQTAPIHTHSAPAVGYVAKGSIIYQIEGEAPQMLNAGDVFFEPVGPRILRFDNASATQEAIFLDFNLEQAGEPFIVFENPPTEAIDRRTLPTIDVEDQNIDQVDIYTNALERGATLKLDVQQQTLGLVAEGIVEVQVKGQPAQRLAAGESFFLPVGKTKTTIVNGSSETPAKVITFRLK